MKKSSKSYFVYISIATLIAVFFIFLPIDKGIYANTQLETNDVVVTPLKENFNFSGNTLTGLNANYLSTLSPEQKQNIRLVIPENTTAISDYAFQQSKYSGCRFIFVDLSNATQLKSIGSFSFYGATNMQGNLQLPEKIETIGNSAFNNCSSLTGDLILPNSLKSIGEHAFNGCSSMKGNLKISNQMNSIANYTFNNCGFTGTLEIPENIKSIGDSAFRQSKAYQGFIGALIIPNNVNSIGSVAFAYQKGITDIQFSKNLTSIKASTFRGTGLKGVLNIPSTIQEIGATAFAETSLQTIYLPKKDSTTAFVQSSSFSSNPMLTAIVCEKDDYNSIYSSLDSTSKAKLGYPIKISFKVGEKYLDESLNGLYNQPFNLHKNTNNSWSINTSYQFPKVTDKVWALSTTAFQEITINNKITQDTLYAITKLEDPKITFSDGIDKVYDGLASPLRVTATHPLAKNIDDAKAGDVVFYYTWRWATIGASDPVLSGFDKNIYEVIDVRQPNFTIIAKVTVQACVVNENNKAVQFYSTNHNFSVDLRQAPPTIHPKYPSERILLADGMPEISLSEDDTKGTIRWDDNQKLKEGIHDYTWTFTPETNKEGSSNYEIATGKATLNAVERITYTITPITENGIIESDSFIVDQGDDVLLKFYPKSGYFLDKALLNGVDITKNIKDESYTINNIREDYEIKAIYLLLPIDEINNKLNEIPIIKDGEISEEQRNTILTIAEYYMDLDKDVQSKISPESIFKIYEALIQLPQIQVGVSNSDLVISDATSLLEAITLDDIQLLIDNPTAELKIEISLVDQEPSLEELEMINKNLNGNTIHQTIDISILKSITLNGVSESSNIGNFNKPIELKLDVPQDMPPLEIGYLRQFSIIRIHNDNGNLQVTTLYDEDTDESTITIYSDKFSTYAITYKDVKDESLNKSFIISATADKNGSISPSQLVSVKEGENQQFVFTPNSGYKVNRVYVDGKDMGNIPSYEFKNVRSNHSIKVTFIEKNPKDEIGNTDDPDTSDRTSNKKYYFLLLASSALLILASGLLINLKSRHQNSKS